MKECKYRFTAQGLPNRIFVCKLLHSSVCCPTDDTECFNILNTKEE